MLDASVAAKWFLPSDWESYSTEAAQLFKRYEKDKLTLYVPDHFWIEMANVLVQAACHKRWSQSEARRALEALQELQIRTFATRRFLPLAIRLALDFDHAVYDCVYVALAMAMHCIFITADEKLANKTAAKLPVKWLGTYDLVTI